MTQEILKVHLRKDNIKYIIVPRSSNIKSGGYVMVSDKFTNIEKEAKNG